MELSRLLVDGNPELHLANFLHMITTMAESGSTEVQTEFFILNSQKVPKLPEEESAWTLTSVPASAENDETLMRSVATLIDEPNQLKSKRRFVVNSNWPPADWKTAPGFGSAFANGLVTQPSSNMKLRKRDNAKEIVGNIDHKTMVEANSDWTIEDDPAATPTVILKDSESLEDHSDYAINMADSGKNIVFDSVDVVVATDGPSTSSSISSERDQLSYGTANAQQALLTGRLGEFVAFKYFSAKVGQTFVNWVNETYETGLPYDIVIGDEGLSREYIEVKATISARKDWFNISAREWQFAVEKGELYSIARVALQCNNAAKVTIYKNPARLCQLGQLQLAVMIPKQQQDF